MSKVRESNAPRKSRSGKSASAASAASQSDGSSRAQTLDSTTSASRNSSKAGAKTDAGDDQPSATPDRKKEESKDVTSTTIPLQAPLPDYDPLEVIPEEYRKHGVDTEPILYYIREKTEEESLEALMEAAQSDVRLHHARIRAALLNNPALLAEYDFMQDATYIARQERKKERIAMVESLAKEAKTILKDLDEEKLNLTQAERTQVKLARWQRALELYVYCPSEMSLDLLGLLEKLLDRTTEVSNQRSVKVAGKALNLVRTNISLWKRISPPVHRNKNSPKSSPRLRICVPLWLMSVIIQCATRWRMLPKPKMPT